MIRAGNPSGIFALHARVADAGIHHGLVKRVPHVQRTRHVRRRQENAVGFFVRVNAGFAVAVLFPGTCFTAVFFFDGRGFVGFC